MYLLNLNSALKTAVLFYKTLSFYPVVTPESLRTDGYRRLVAPRVARSQPR